MEIKMAKKIQLFSLMFFIFLFSLTTVLADLSVKYTVYEGELDSSGNLLKKSNTISNFNVDVYSCTNSDCTTISSLIPSLSSSTSSDNIVISYPHDMVTEYGYALYFYNDDYIGYQLWNEKAWGTSSTIYEGQKVYLSKRIGGHIPISDIEFDSQTQKNKDTNLKVKINMDSSDYVLITDEKHFDTGLNEKVKTNVTLKIINSSGIIFQDEKTIQVPYGEGLSSVDFNYTFSEVGYYDIFVETEIIDSKFKLTTNVNKTKQIKVISDTKNNYSSSYIVNLDYSGLNQDINNEIFVNFKSRSTYMDEFGVSFNLDSLVKTSVKYDDTIVKTETKTIGYDKLYSLSNYKLENEGIYNVSFEVCPIETTSSSDKVCTSFYLIYNVTEDEVSLSSRKNSEEQKTLDPSEAIIYQADSENTRDVISLEESFEDTTEKTTEPNELVFFILASAFGVGSVSILTFIILKFVLFL